MAETKVELSEDSLKAMVRDAIATKNMYGLAAARNAEHVILLGATVLSLRADLEKLTTVARKHGWNSIRQSLELFTEEMLVEREEVVGHLRACCHAYGANSSEMTPSQRIRFFRDARAVLKRLGREVANG